MGVSVITSKSNKIMIFVLYSHLSQAPSRRRASSSCQYWLGFVALSLSLWLPGCGCPQIINKTDPLSSLETNWLNPQLNIAALLLRNIIPWIASCTSSRRLDSEARRRLAEKSLDWKRR